jgi:hypothetical protein
VIIGYMSAKAEVPVPKSLVPFHTVVASKADSVVEPATSERATVNTVPLASRGDTCGVELSPTRSARDGGGRALHLRRRGAESAAVRERSFTSWTQSSHASTQPPLCPNRSRDMAMEMLLIDAVDSSIV